MRYTYEIQANYSTDEAYDREAWDLVDPGATGTEDYDGNAYDYGHELLNSHYSNNPDHWTTEPGVELRVLVWIADSDEVGDASQAIAMVTTNSNIQVAL